MFKIKVTRHFTLTRNCEYITTYISTRSFKEGEEYSPLRLREEQAIFQRLHSRVVNSYYSRSLRQIKFRTVVHHILNKSIFYGVCLSKEGTIKDTPEHHLHTPFSHISSHKKLAIYPVICTHKSSHYLSTILFLYSTICNGPK